MSCARFVPEQLQVRWIAGSVLLAPTLFVAPGSVRILPLLPAAQSSCVCIEGQVGIDSEIELMHGPWPAEQEALRLRASRDTQ